MLFKVITPKHVVLQVSELYEKFNVENTSLTNVEWTSAIRSLKEEAILTDTQFREALIVARYVSIIMMNHEQEDMELMDLYTEILMAFELVHPEPAFGSVLSVNREKTFKLEFGMNVYNNDIIESSFSTEMMTNSFQVFQYQKKTVIEIQKKDTL